MKIKTEMLIIHNLQKDWNGGYLPNAWSTLGRKSQVNSF